MTERRARARTLLLCVASGLALCGSVPPFGWWPLAALAFLVSGCHAGSSSYSPSEVAATVNGVPIGKERIDMIMKQRSMQGRPEMPGMRKEIIENLATQVLASEEAIKKGLDKKPEVAEQMEMARRSIEGQPNLTPDQRLEALKGIDQALGELRKDGADSEED